MFKENIFYTLGLLSAIVSGIITLGCESTDSQNSDTGSLNKNQQKDNSLESDSNEDFPNADNTKSLRADSEGPPVKRNLQKVELAEDQCQEFANNLSVPSYLEDLGVFVTKILKPCITRKGKKGFLKGSPFTVMVIPCTNGGGQLDYSGYYYRPKIARFLIPTDCPFAPNVNEAIEKQIVEKLGLDPTSKLAAVNPFALQFWEVSGYPDSDVDNTIELTSKQALDSIWNNYKENKPFMARIWGRESTWIKDNTFYEMQIKIFPGGQSSFSIQVLEGKALSSEEAEALKNKCMDLRPSRNCATVFQ